MPRRLPCLATCHSWYSKTVKLKVLEHLDKMALRRFDHVVAVSEGIYSDLRASRIPEGRLSRVDNGIGVPQVDPHARHQIRAEWNIAEGDKLIVQIGRLAHSKRNALLLKAVAGLPGDITAKVVFVGEGEERAALAACARSLGIDSRVSFAGYRRDAAAVMVAADALAITSNKEGLPIVMLEAMAVGCPVIATAVGAIPEILNSASAWIVPPEDEAALLRALLDALGEPSPARVRAARAKAIFLERHTRDVMGSRYLNLYEGAWRERGW